MANRVGKTQIERARGVNLNSYMLDVYPDETKREGHDFSRWMQNKAVVFSKNGFCDNSTGRKDHALSFLYEYLKMPFRDAVRALCDYDDGRSIDVSSRAPSCASLPDSAGIDKPASKSNRSFVAPHRAALYKYELYNYLSEKRGIDALFLDPEIVYPTISHGHVNAVFLSRDCDYAEIRGTEPKLPFKGKAAGSDHDGYWIVGSLSPKTICVCESAIDALSLLNIYQMDGYDFESYKMAFVSIGGCGCTAAVKRVQKRYPNATLHLCFDNDEAGRNAAMALPQYLSHFPNSPHKDWNDVLVARRRCKTKIQGDYIE
ncbi:MAG: toprim domain-containing protein [Clostridia bacterium]|nr:toprim domain-containing protein [Clostridia bacterium]